MDLRGFARQPASAPPVDKPVNDQQGNEQRDCSCSCCHAFLLF